MSTAARATATCDSIVLSNDVSELGRLRGWLRGRLSAHDAQSRDEAIVVAHELAANSIRHSGGCEVHTRVTSSRVRLEVHDPSPVFARRRTPDSTGGRGLPLIAGLAAAWGQHRDRGGKTVWAEVELTASAG